MTAFSRHMSLHMSLSVLGKTQRSEIYYSTKSLEWRDNSPKFALPEKGR